jgi:hypothetical protein
MSVFNLKKKQVRSLETKEVHFHQDGGETQVTD